MIVQQMKLAKRRKSAGKPKPAPSSSTVTKSSKKAPKKSNKWNKSLSEEEMRDLSGQLEVVARQLYPDSKNNSRCVWGMRSLSP